MEHRFKMGHAMFPDICTCGKDRKDHKNPV